VSSPGSSDSRARGEVTKPRSPNIGSGCEMPVGFTSRILEVAEEP
jgi:hypothetical protein